MCSSSPALPRMRTARRWGSWARPRRGKRSSSPRWEAPGFASGSKGAPACRFRARSHSFPVARRARRCAGSYARISPPTLPTAEAAATPAIPARAASAASVALAAPTRMVTATRTRAAGATTATTAMSGSTRGRQRSATFSTMTAICPPTRSRRPPPRARTTTPVPSVMFVSKASAAARSWTSTRMGIHPPLAEAETATTGTPPSIPGRPRSEAWRAPAWTASITTATV